MTGDAWDAQTLRPGQDCARFADWLPLLTQTPPAGLPTGQRISSDMTDDVSVETAVGLNGDGAPEIPDMNALRAHVDACAYCQRQLAAYSATEQALRSEYAIPTGRAPFLTLDAIVQRVAMQDAQDAQDAPFLPPSRERAGSVGSVAQAPTTTPTALYWTHTARQQGALHEIVGSMTPYNESEQRQATLDEPTPSGTSAPHVRAMQPALLSAQPGRSRNRRFIQALAGLVAAAVIVGLFGALFYTFGASHRRPNQATQQTKTLHYLGANGHWVEVSHFTNTAYMGIAVAPSNPQVIYATSSTVKLWRSDDGGQTWTPLSAPTGDLPSPTAASYPQIMVSPLNPQVVIVTLNSGSSNPHCPASKLGPGTLAPPSAKTQTRLLSEDIPLSGGYTCTFQYVSSNGGASWSKLALTDQVKLSTFGSALRVGGTHLYDVAQPDVNGEAAQTSRLMGSADGGVTWAPADAALAASGQGILQYATTTTGNTLFAVTIPNTALSGDGNTYTPTLWRSDDAGAHWTNEGKFNQPAPDKYGMTGQYNLLTATSVGGQTLLYELKPGYTSHPKPTVMPFPEQPFTPNTIAPGDIFVSADNGHTWSEASKQGVPAGLYAGSFFNQGVTGTLGDGQIALLFYQSIAHITPVPNGSKETLSMKDAAYYAWAPASQSWRQLTPSFEGEIVAQQWITPANGSQPETIWQVLRSGTTGATITLERCALT